MACDLITYNLTFSRNCFFNLDEDCQHGYSVLEHTFQ
jgi:hypothetical protein